MPRIQIPQVSVFPFHITSRCPNRAPFPIELAKTWEIFENHLFFCRHGYGLKIHQFVLMPNHFHLVATADNVPIGKVMNYLLKEVSKELNEKAEKINQNFGDRYYKTLITSPHYALNVYKYVYQNPLRANLCSYSEEWPWSTLHGLVGLRKLIIPIEADTVLFNPNFDDQALKWINQKSEQAHLEELRRYLKKGIMHSSTDRKTTRTSSIEHQRI